MVENNEENRDIQFRKLKVDGQKVGCFNLHRKRQEEGMKYKS